MSDAIDSPPPQTPVSPAEAETSAPAMESAPSEPAAAIAAEVVDPLEKLRSDAVRAAFAAGNPIEGKVIGWNQGGFHVVIDGEPAFCPRSEMELGEAQAPASYLDQSFLFRILRVEDRGRRIVVSRRGVLREQRKAQTQEIWSTLTPGTIVTGKVASLTDFGAFVDLGGVQGMIHVSELSSKRVGKPADLLAVGQEVRAQVLKAEKKARRIALSLKALEPDPWSGVVERYPRGGKFRGTVLRASPFGLFVEVEPGVEGLLHTSQLPPGKSMDDPAFAAGQAVEGWVRESDAAQRKISLSLREVAAGDPWQGAAERYPEGDVFEGTVESVSPKGVSILLEAELAGFLPASETGIPKGSPLGRAYAPGKRVRVRIAEIDPRRRRLSLVTENKQLEGSRQDFKSYKDQQRREEKRSGFTPFAAALEKLRQPPK